MPHRKSQVQAVEVEAPERCCLPTFDHLGNTEQMSYEHQVQRENSQGSL